MGRRLGVSTTQIRTCLWFDADGHDAAAYYTSLIPDSEITRVSYYTDASSEHGEKGSVLEVDFRLGDQKFVALNGGPHFPQTEAASIQVYVDSQDELDRIWDGLTADGGFGTQCGWLKDKYGVSWQVIPTRLTELASSQDSAVSERVIAKMLTMVKLDIAPLEEAAAGA